MTTSISTSSQAQPLHARRALAFAGALILSGTCASGFAATYTVTNTQNAGSGSLRQAILDANASGAHAGIVNGSNTINVTATGTINLSDALPMVFSNLTINGNGITVDGGNAHRCFFISGLPTTATGMPQSITATLQNMHLAHCRARGGDGGSSLRGGGGGLGAGGALFIDSNASVVISGVSFDGNSAAGGNGGNSVTTATTALTGAGGGGIGGVGGGPGCGNGGGGIGGNGGNGFCDFSSGNGAGGSGGGIGGNGGAGEYGSGGGGGFGGIGIGQIEGSQGLISGGVGYPGLSGGTNGGGGGGGGAGGTAGQSGSLGGDGGVGGGVAGGGGGGGSGAANGTASAGGAGGIGGGGGGSILMEFQAVAGGPGGFGGGGGGLVGSGGFGGGGADAASGGFGGGGGGGNGGLGGNGGFGGGGGGGQNGGSGGFGAGAGSNADSDGGGGGGAGLGGAIFVVDGGMLSIDEAGSLAGSQIAGGAGGLGSAGATTDGAPGSAFGAGIFLQGSGTLAFNANNGALYTLTDGIGDVQGSGGGTGSWGLDIGGDGTGGLELDGVNTYSGPTAVSGAALIVNGSATSTIIVDTDGIFSGAGTVGDVLSNGVVFPADGSGSITPLIVSNFSQSSLARLDIALDDVGNSTRLSVTHTAGLDGTLHLQFIALPPPGKTYTVLNAAAINGSFARYQSNIRSVFGEISYSPHSVLFTVIANDLVFRDGFEGSDAATTGTCSSPQQFTAISGAALNNLPVCIPPFTSTIAGNTVVACQTSMCSAAAAGCPTMLHAGSGVLSGTLSSGMYQVDTPITIDTITAPLNISGLAGNVNCTATASNTSAGVSVDYLASRDSLGDAFVYAFGGVQTNSLNTSVSSSGCGLYGQAISAFASYLIPQLQAQLNNAINSSIPSGATAPGVGATICPAP